MLLLCTLTIPPNVFFFEESENTCVCELCVVLDAKTQM